MHFPAVDNRKRFPRFSTLLLTFDLLSAESPLSTMVRPKLTENGAHVQLHDQKKQKCLTHETRKSFSVVLILHQNAVIVHKARNLNIVLTPRKCNHRINFYTAPRHSAVQATIRQHHVFYSVQVFTNIAS